MARGEAHLVVNCGNCGAPQPLTLSAPLGTCEHCGRADSVKPELRERLDRLRARLAERDRTPNQLTSKSLVAGDGLQGAGVITIIVCWLLFGGVALYVSFSHDVGFVEFVTGGKPALQWWLLWSFALGLALSVGLLEFTVARVRGLSAQALPSPPIRQGAQPRCRCCAAELDAGGALRRCGSCQTDNLVVGSHYLRAEDNLDRALDDIEKRFERNLKARIDAGGIIAMAAGVGPCFLLFIGPIAGHFTPGRPELWLIPGVAAALAVALALFARHKRLPIEAVELLSIGDRVGLGDPVSAKRGVCAQVMLETGPVSLLGKTAEQAEFAVATERRDGLLHVTVYRIKPGTEPPSDLERDKLVPADLWDKKKKSAPVVRRVHTLATEDGWRTFVDTTGEPLIDASRIDTTPDVWVY